VQIVPTSITTTSGSGSVSTTGTVSFTSASAVSLNGVFSSTYDNYLIVCSMVGSTSTNINARMRAAGSDNSTSSSYIRQRLYIASTSVEGTSTTSNLWDNGIIGTNISSYLVELFDPFLASMTAFSSRSGSGAIFLDAKGYHTQTVSYDSYTFSAASGTITGKASIYGYKK
jgi:hypothetical protein